LDRRTRGALVPSPSEGSWPPGGGIGCEGGGVDAVYASADGSMFAGRHRRHRTKNEPAGSTCFPTCPRSSSLPTHAPHLPSTECFRSDSLSSSHDGQTMIPSRIGEPRGRHDMTRVPVAPCRRSPGARKSREVEHPLRCSLRPAGRGGPPGRVLQGPGKWRQDKAKRGREACTSTT